MEKKEIARVAHLVNKAYCEALGDFSQPEWEDAPAHHTPSDIHALVEMGEAEEVKFDKKDECATFYFEVNERSEEERKMGLIRTTRAKDNSMVMFTKRISYNAELSCGAINCLERRRISRQLGRLVSWSLLWRTKK